jgi:CDP-diacylglycerol--serine O-phosphatidyltransferase
MLSLAAALLGFICDSLDGPLARHFRVETRIGAAYDALVDLVLYLVYPAVTWYVYFDLNDILALFILLFFLACGSFRLVRTAAKGVQQKEGRPYFIGIPVVLSLPLLAGSFTLTHIAPTVNTAFFYVLLPLFSLSMISRIPFPKPAGREMYILLFLTGAVVLLLLVL